MAVCTVFLCSISFLLPFTLSSFLVSFISVMGIDSNLYQGEGILVFVDQMSALEKKAWAHIFNWLNDDLDLYQEAVHYDSYADTNEVLLGCKNSIRGDWDRTPDTVAATDKKFLDTDTKKKTPLKGVPEKLGQWNLYAKELGDDPRFDSLTSSVPAFFIAIEGGPSAWSSSASFSDQKREKIIQDYLIYLKQKETDLQKRKKLEMKPDSFWTHLTTFLSRPHLSLPAVWLALYYF